MNALLPYCCAGVRISNANGRGAPLVTTSSSQCAPLKYSKKEVIFTKENGSKEAQGLYDTAQFQ